MNTADINLVSDTNKISRESFKHDYFDSQEYFDPQLGEHYIRHNINVYNKLKFKDSVFDAMYQTGCSFRYGDYTLPSNELELSVNDRTDRTLIEVSRLSNNDLQDELSINNIINFLNCPSIENKEDLIVLFNALKQNLEMAKTYLKDMDIDLVMSRALTTASQQDTVENV